VTVPLTEAEPARATFIALFPAGFEERGEAGLVELAAYTDGPGEARVREAFSRVRTSDVAPGWEERWREFHRPVRIGPLWVGPPWEKPPQDALAVVIDPGRAFGTGAHATTRLCLELLVDLGATVGPVAVLDIGCGSGVLAIAAARLGYAPAYAVDLEHDAVEATTRNAAANRVTVDTRLADALQEELPEADVAVANITCASVEAVAPRLRCLFLIASGYLEKEAVGLAGFSHRERRVAEGWAADVYERA
jgi:ribosomal protein L11 methyltransferase